MTTTTANGFSALVDPPPIEVREENIAPYSFPQEAFTFWPDDTVLISRFKNNDKERKIHCNIELTDEELTNLKNVQNEAAKLGKTYFVSITVMSTRYISYARGDVTKAIKLMDETQAWRTDYFGKGPIKDTDVIDDLNRGVLYFSGRDFALRPILVVRAERVPKEWDKDGTGVTRLIRMLVFCMEYLRRYMFYPGRVENIIVLIDLKNLGASQVPVTALKNIYSVLSHHYIVRVYKFYIVNMSWLLGSVASMVKPILTERQRQKLNFLDNAKDCAEMCAAHQLEDDFGGARPKITKFFPFPLEPGPFDKGYKQGARRDAVQGCHKALTPEGFRGHVWDSAKSKDENLSHSYTQDAEAIFNKCNVPLPANCPRQAVSETPQEKAAPEEKAPEEPKTAEEEEAKRKSGNSKTEETPKGGIAASGSEGSMQKTETSTGDKGVTSMWVNNPSEKPPATEETKNPDEVDLEVGDAEQKNKPPPKQPSCKCGCAIL